MKRVLALAFIAALSLSACGEESPTARPYKNDSIWNDTITQKQGTLQTSNPNASQFGTMFFGGLSSSDQPYAKMTYLAAPGDPCRGFVLRHTDWNNSNTKIPSGDCIPVPDGVQAATGSDGHLTIISADLTVAWDFWRCKQGSDSGTACNETNVLAGRYEAANGSKWRIHPDDSLATGVASCCGAATGRGSGTELISTVLKLDEATYGIAHAGGLTLPGGASNLYVNPPAVKSDGSSGNPIKYGSLWALRPDYVCPTATGPKNVCEAYKAYGVFIVDQASGSGSETDTTGPSEGVANFAAIGITRNSLPIQGSDWRCVLLPTVSGECP